MAARQFGFVIARGLAVWAWLWALNLLLQLYMMSQGGIGLNGVMRFPIGILCASILAGTLLWTNADKFAGPVADAKAEASGGQWIPRLVLFALGLLLVFWSLHGVFDLVLRLVNPIFNASPSNGSIPWSWLLAEVARFFMGLWLALANRPRSLTKGEDSL